MTTETMTLNNLEDVNEFTELRAELEHQKWLYNDLEKGTTALQESFERQNNQIKTLKDVRANLYVELHASEAFMQKTINKLYYEKEKAKTDLSDEKRKNELLEKRLEYMLELDLTMKRTHFANCDLKRENELLERRLKEILESTSWQERNYE